MAVNSHSQLVYLNRTADARSRPSLLGRRVCGYPVGTKPWLPKKTWAPRGDSLWDGWACFKPIYSLYVCGDCIAPGLLSFASFALSVYPAPLTTTLSVYPYPYLSTHPPPELQLGGMRYWYRYIGNYWYLVYIYMHAMNDWSAWCCMCVYVKDSAAPAWWCCVFHILYERYLQSGHERAQHKHTYAHAHIILRRFTKNY